jgi:ubiquinol-cytochrome c reductase cytochrome c subunit
VRRLAIAVPAVLVAATACSWLGHTTRYEPNGIRAVQPETNGRDAFLRDCAWCHGNAGQGTTRAVSLVTGNSGAALTDFMLSTGRMPLTDLNEPIVRRPAAYPPALIAQIADYVASLGGGGPAIPAPDPAAGDLARGEDLYQTNCAACHSATGIGGTLSQRGVGRSGAIADRYGGVIPALNVATPIQIAEAMRTGPGTMPVFGSNTFSDQDVNSIVRYLQYLQHPANRGGARLGGIGPVAEGAVAWAVGIGALLLLARWIGETVRHHG